MLNTGGRDLPARPARGTEVKMRSRTVFALIGLLLLPSLATARTGKAELETQNTDLAEELSIDKDAICRDLSVKECAALLGGLKNIEQSGRNLDGILDTLGVLTDDLGVAVAIDDLKRSQRKLDLSMILAACEGLVDEACIPTIIQLIALIDSGADPSQALATLITARAEAAKQTENQQAQKSFLGVNFGIGFGISSDIEGGERVDAAEVVNGIVRITKEQSTVPRILLEAHYFVLQGDCVQTGQQKKECMRGSGPFIALQSSGEEVLDGFALGWMYGWRRKPNQTNSFNLGAGFILDRNVQVLGDGMEANQPLPPGETEVRYKDESRWGALLFTSFSF
jgi:hypothetical protein